jgi:transposase
MKTAVTRHGQDSVLGQALYLAFELGEKVWKLGFTTGAGQRPRLRTVTARDVDAVLAEVERAKGRFELGPSVSVVSCYEAGRDGFWLHRCLVHHGIENMVVDSSSIEVKRRSRRAKTDRLDVGKLLTMLLRYCGGEQKVWSVVHVPTVEAEDRRQLHRELLTVKRDRTRVTNRMKGLASSQGVVLSLGAGFVERLDAVGMWDGSPMPSALRARLEREWLKVEGLTGQIKVLEADRAELLRTCSDPAVETARQLLLLRGIGTNSAWLYAMEFFSWRGFRNQREVGALAGLSPTPYDSGGLRREQGMSKAGNRHIRAMAIEIAWGWLRFQPDSALTRWYEERFGGGSSRVRRIGIVALARRLLVELWRYLETGAVPEGAVLKA